MVGSESPLYDATTSGEGASSLGEKVLHAYTPATYAPATAAALMFCSFMSVGGPVTLGISLLFLLIFSGVLEKLLEKGMGHYDKGESKGEPKSAKP